MTNDDTELLDEYRAEYKQVKIWLDVSDITKSNHTKSELEQMLADLSERIKKLESKQTETIK